MAYGDIENVKNDVIKLNDIIDRQGTSLLLGVIAEKCGISVNKFKMNEEERKILLKSIMDELREAILERIQQLNKGDNMSNLHKSKRRVLEVNKFLVKGVKVTQVTWCVVTKENSRSVYSDHVGVTTYYGSVKHSGISAWMSRKAERTSKIDLESQKNESLNMAYYNSLEGTKRIGIIAWFDERKGVGYVKDSEIDYVIPVYLCNVIGANSAHQDLVTNKTLVKDQVINYTLGDYYTTRQCGAIQVEVKG